MTIQFHLLSTSKLLNITDPSLLKLPLPLLALASKQPLLAGPIYFPKVPQPPSTHIFILLFFDHFFLKLKYPLNIPHQTLLIRPELSTGALSIKEFDGNFSSMPTFTVKKKKCYTNSYWHCSIAAHSCTRAVHWAFFLNRMNWDELQSTCQTSSLTRFKLCKNLACTCLKSPTPIISLFVLWYFENYKSTRRIRNLLFFNNKEDMSWQFKRDFFFFHHRTLLKIYNLEVLVQNQAVFVDSNIFLQAKARGVPMIVGDRHSQNWWYSKKHSRNGIQEISVLQNSNDQRTVLFLRLEFLCLFLPKWKRKRMVSGCKLIGICFKLKAISLS
ncbi:hypothetical protein VP01_3851g1 [Puccinia sorghi]|uniref:Uncharacterized protein n=1 Tax=Puccinia sorghi TaxID=27349 RepID=A0A0L6UV02_9BASI|nr:hypothetical protein VP01_3851g1 [Puccinia sorghi]